MEISCLVGLQLTITTNHYRFQAVRWNFRVQIQLDQLEVMPLVLSAIQRAKCNSKPRNWHYGRK